MGIAFLWGEFPSSILQDPREVVFQEVHCASPQKWTFHTGWANHDVSFFQQHDWGRGGFVVPKRLIGILAQIDRHSQGSSFSCGVVKLSQCESGAAVCSQLLMCKQQKPILDIQVEIGLWVAEGIPGMARVSCTMFDNQKYGPKLPQGGSGKDSMAIIAEHETLQAPELTL